MFSAVTEKNVVITNDFDLEEKGRLLKAWLNVVILAEMNKRLWLSAPEVIALFKEKYNIQISSGTIYPIFRRMEKKRDIKILPNRSKNFIF